MEVLTPARVFRAPRKHQGGVITTGRPDHAYRAYELLYFGFMLAPLVAGIDKFFNYLTDWGLYLAPVLERMAGGTQLFMRGVGIIEICAGLLVATMPRIGGIVVACWLWGICINLMMLPGYFDIVLRDFCLSLGALALSQLAAEYDRAETVIPRHH